MKGSMLLAVILAVAIAALVVWEPAHAGTSVGVSIQVGDPYRGASLYFRSEPDVVLVPDTRVYYVRDYDCDLYRYGRYWYFMEEGHWYRAKTWRGPFIHVHARSVPRAIVTVPVKYRRHWYGPPAHAKAHGYHRNHAHREVHVEREVHEDRDGHGHKHKHKR